jgi:nitrate/TMAO reductase-like tetraheme cytochrome c subunit
MMLRMDHGLTLMELLRWAALALGVLSLALLGHEAIMVRRRVRRGLRERLLVFAGVALLPFSTVALGQGVTVERMQEVKFCQSCHIMHPWVEGLKDKENPTLSALHVQNRRVNPETACYTCHSDYSLVGPVLTKLRGLRHVYGNYILRHKGEIRMFTPFRNSTCLHCHGGARNFEEHAAHVGVLDQLKDESLTCLTCHGPAHPAQVEPPK